MSIAQQMGKFVQKLKGFDRVLHEVKFISAGNGSIHCELKLSDEHLNVMGNIHSGYVVTLVDVISGMGLLTYKDGFKPSASVNINVNYLAEAKAGDTIEIVGRTIKLGKSLGFLELEMKNKDTGEIIATGCPITIMTIYDKVIRFINKGHGFENIMKNVKLLSAEKGRCLAEFKVAEEHLNYMNGLHGGYSATIVDKYTSAALHTIIDDDYQDVTVNLNVSYLKGARLGDDVLVDTRSLKVGKNVAFLEAYLKNKKNEELLMYGSQILFLVKPKAK